MIHYRTRDITKIISYEPCDCGRTHVGIDKIKGRCDDMLKVKEVNFYLSQIKAILIVIETVKGEDEMTILVEKVRDLSQEEMDRLKLEL
ncbi:MAG: hypothetical protein ACO2OY_03555 [Thermodesulfobacteriaceae bacterium]